MGGKDEVAPTVVGGALPQAVQRKPPTFGQRWYSPISYVLYLWYGSILRLVSVRPDQPAHCAHCRRAAEQKPAA
jgi:hypothetical protein